VTAGLALLLKALVAPTALESRHLVSGEEGICVPGVIALEERNILAHSLLNGTCAFGMRFTDRRSIKARRVFLPVPPDAVAKWQGTVAMLYTRTTSDTTDVDMSTIDGIVQIPRRASTGGT